MEKMEHIILEEQKGDRIDKAISTFNSEWSRTQVQQWIKDEHVLVNGKPVKTNYKCTINDKIEIVQHVFDRPGIIITKTKGFMGERIPKQKSIRVAP